MRFGVVGTGSIGQRHCQNLAALGHQVVAWDPMADRLRAAAETSGVSAAVALDAVLAERPDAVLVCTPPAHHLDVAHRAIVAGCHVFVEKPIAQASAGVPELLDDARRRGRRVVVGFNLRLLPSLQRVRALLDAKRVGRVLSVRAEFGGYLPDWRAGRDYRDNYAVSAAQGGGILLDAIHEIDYLGWLFGDADEVSAAVEHVSDLAGDTEDLAEVTIRFASGVLAQVHLDYLQRAYRRNLQVIGEGGTVLWDFPSHSVTVREAAPAPEAIDLAADEGDPNAMYVEEMRQLVRCVEGRESAMVDGREALASLLVVEAAKASARERRWMDVRGGAA
jgi:predicted dehydrogenase